MGNRSHTIHLKLFCATAKWGQHHKHRSRPLMFQELCQKSCSHGFFFQLEFARHGYNKMLADWIAAKLRGIEPCEVERFANIS